LSVCLAVLFSTVIVFFLAEVLGKPSKKSLRPVDAILGHWQRDDEHGDDQYYLRKEGSKIINDAYTSSGHRSYTLQYSVKSESLWTNSVTLVNVDDPKSLSVLKLTNGNQRLNVVGPGWRGVNVTVPWARVGDETQRPADLKPTGKSYAEMDALEREAHDAMQALKQSNRTLDAVTNQSSRAQAGVATLGLLAVLMGAIWFVVPRDGMAAAYFGLCVLCLIAGSIASRSGELAYVRNNCFIGAVVAIVLSRVTRR
jgi:hypothetical protein